MKRFPEQFDRSNPDEVYLAGLLQHAQRLEPSAEQKQRVWTTLERSGPRRPRRRVGGPIIAGLLLCGATVASATLPRVWRGLTTIAIAPPATTTIAAATQATPRRVPPPAPPVPVIPEPTWAPPPLPETPAAQPATMVRKSPSSKPRVPATESVDSLTSGVPLVEAIRERRAGHVARARELANEYRAKNPSGALYEEALALAVETSATLGDDEAKQLAHLYLERYPRGRFRAQAQRVVDNAR